MGLSSKGDGYNTRSTFYRLEIMRIELFSVYGIQARIDGPICEFESIIRTVEEFLKANDICEYSSNKCEEFKIYLLN